YSLFPIPYSLFPIPYSLFPIPYSLFPIPYSLFPIPYSLFPILIVLFLIGCEQNNFVLPEETDTLSTQTYQLESRSGVTIVSNGVSSPRFAFNGEIPFGNFMHELETFDLDSFLNTLTAQQYESFYRRTGIDIDAMETFDEPVLETILNAYGVVEIDGYIIRLNPDWDEAYIISNTASPMEQKAFERAASDVDVCGLPTPTVKLPLESDFFAIKAAGGLDIINIDDIDDDYVPDPGTDDSDDDSDGDSDGGTDDSCSDVDDDEDEDRRCGGCADRTSLSDDDRYDDCGGEDIEFLGELTVLYRRFSFWERMKVKFSHKCKDGCRNLKDGTKEGIPEEVSYVITYTASWTPRCKGNHARQGEMAGYAQKDEASIYSSTRCLNQYRLRAYGTFRDRCGTSYALGPLEIARD
ncbi:MAG: hypothetical protein AAF849_20890, partial [Bacteroidota bacterium]